MIDFGNLAADIARAAKTAASVIPGLQGASAAIAVAEKLVGLIDSLAPHADTGTQAEMQVSRAALAKAVAAKAERTADRFDG